MNKLFTVSLVISSIACFNYGFLAVFNFDILENLFVNYSLLLNSIYFIFGICAFINIASHSK